VNSGLADIFTPVGIYLRLRDRFRDTILLESTDSHAADNSYSFIGVNAIGGIEVREDKTVEIKLPTRDVEYSKLNAKDDLQQLLSGFMDSFETVSSSQAQSFAQGFYGYCSFDAIPFLKTSNFPKEKISLIKFPLPVTGSINM
jgi:anthranilate synthase component I